MQPDVRTDPPLLSVRNLRTYFLADEGTTKAVDGVSFDVSAGRTLGIVGESGCGKSVTALSILRIVDDPGRIVDGEILLSRNGGRPVDLVKQRKNGKFMRSVRGGEIGLVFQEPMTSFSPVHTIGNQLVEAIRLHDSLTKKQARDKATDLLTMVGIPRPASTLDQYSWELSGGLRQRAMIAHALAPDPRLLIADEPTTALDVTTQAQILDLMMSLQEERSMAVMLITHDLGVIAETADEVVVMYLGREVEKGSVEDIFYDPQHPYTRALLRSIPSLDAAPKLKLPAITGSVPHPFDRPSGCGFHPRCPEAMESLCDIVEPPTWTPADGREVACHLFGDHQTVVSLEGRRS